MSSTSVTHVVDDSQPGGPGKPREPGERRESTRRGVRAERPHGPEPAGSIGAGGIEGLYRASADRLEQIVRGAVDAPPAVIEDACAAAWSRLILHAAHVRREAALAWLIATAVHEAWKLVRREARELSMEAVIDQIGDGELHPVVAGADEVFEQHERIALVDGLPPRQRRILWLHAAGLSYLEMAEAAGCTRRTVGREMVRARRGVRALAAA